jgi:hypothetical protein
MSNLKLFRKLAILAVLATATLVWYRPAFSATNCPNQCPSECISGDRYQCEVRIDGVCKLINFVCP